ncbi:MAG: hypothetical protein IPK07_12830 [Deltaproteobacteria bacterium]|nr:hypothetical protein [Deltaproteobacteria bacterium]
MTSAPGSDLKSERAWARDGALFAWFLGALLATTALAVVLVAQHQLDVPFLVSPRGHVAAGIALYPLFLVLVARHVARIAGRTAATATLLCLLSPVTVFWAHVPPSFAMGIGLVPLVPLTFVYMRIHRSGHRWVIVAGVVTLALTHVVLTSGVFLGVFDPTAMSGDLLGRRRMWLVHAWLGIPTASLLLWHGLARYYGRGYRPTAGWGRTAFTIGCTLAVLIVLAGWMSRDARSQIRFATPGEGLPGGQRVVELTSIPAGSGHGVDFTRIVDPAVCGRCHGEIYDQWLVSPHRFAATNRPYARAVAKLAEEEGDAATAFCARCHNPLAAVLGLSEGSTDPMFESVSRVGITCQYCHIITRTDPVTGNGEVTITFERRYRPAFALGLWAPRKEDEARFLSDGLVGHAEDYKHESYFDSEFCAGCHRITTPHALNGGVDFVQEDLFTPWRETSSAREDVGCTGCHMQLNVFDDPIHARPDHRTFGTLRALTPVLPAWFETSPLVARFESDIARWSVGNLPVSTYEQVYLASIQSQKSKAHRRFLHGKKALTVALEVPRAVHPGAALALTVRTTNGTHAHPLPSGPLDMNELWLEATVTDAGGAVLLTSGALLPDGRVEPGARRLGGTLVDAAGQPIRQHRIWRAARVENARFLPPDGDVTDAFSVPIPADARGPLTITARWRYRRIEPGLAAWMLGESAALLPTETLDEAHASVAVE